MSVKIKIAIIFGGCSSEYAVSLKSAHAVITHLDGRKYDLVLLGVTPSGEWFRFSGDVDRIKDDTWLNHSDCTKAIISPSRETGGVLVFEETGARAIRLDAAMPVLHGKNGEDGTVQGLLELAGIPVVGCGSLSSALCMDKDRAHKLAKMAGVRIPRSFVLKRGADIASAQVMPRAKNLGYPLFVKPVKAGSSIGITMVSHESKLPAAINIAFEHDDEVLVEERINGVEIGCAVLGAGSPVVGELDEIELSGGFFDYKEKYTLETSAIHVPARVFGKKAAEIKETAKIIYKALGCHAFARVDMFLTPYGEIIFNEVNTIPGFTAHSRYPNMLKEAGISFEQILDTAIGLAVGREEERLSSGAAPAQRHEGSLSKVEASAHGHEAPRRRSA